MKKIQISEIKQGMVVAEDIYSNGVLIIADGVALREEHIKYLKYESEYFELRVYNIDEQKHNLEGSSCDSESRDVLNDEKLDKRYRKSIESVKDIFLSIKIGGKLVYEEIEDIVDEFMNEIQNSPDIACKIWQIHESDQYIFEHSVQVSIYVMLCGNWLGMATEEIKELAISGLLHDIGKCNIPDEILNKPGTLSEEEFKVVRTHSTIGYMILSNTNRYSSAILAGVLQHHERCDGSGYPYGLMEDAIHGYARIIAIADVYTAMISDRPYASAESPFFVIGKLYRRALGALDPFYTKVFVENMIQYFLGCKVRLSNGKEGKIIFIEKIYPDKPIIQVEDGLINLSEHEEIFIEYAYQDEKKLNDNCSDIS